MIHFARNALADTELGGQLIRAGDQVVVLFYCSGNPDEAVWDEPRRFDVRRPRSPHVAFGGGGVHYCLGNGIAKTQLRALFSQVLTHLPHLELGEPVYLNSDLFNGVKRCRPSPDPARLPLVMGLPGCGAAGGDPDRV